jgi:hypothetical protein
LYTFNKGFTEEVRDISTPRELTQVTSPQDELWTPDDRETIEHIDARAQSVLHDIWQNYPVDTCKYRQYRLV